MRQARILTTEARAPDADRSSSAAVNRESRNTIGICLGKHVAINDQYITEHLIVNIAAKGNDTAALENHGWMSISLVKRQNEVVGVRKRIHMMGDYIAVGKPDLGSNLDNEQVRFESCVNLVHYGMPGWWRKSARFRKLHIHGNIGNRRSVHIQDRDFNVACSGSEPGKNAGDQS